MIVKKKLIILLLLISSVPLLIVSSVSLFLFSNNLRYDFRDLNTERANLLQTDVSQFIDKHMDVLKLLSKTAAVRSYDVSASKPLLVETSKTYPNFDPISVDSAQAKQIVRSDSLGLVDVADREFYRLAMRGQEEVVSDVLTSKATGHPIVILATPIKAAENGAITGVLQGTIDLDVLVEFVGKRSTDGNVAYILDPKGKVIAHQIPILLKNTKI